MKKMSRTEKRRKFAAILAILIILAMLVSLIAPIASVFASTVNVMSTMPKASDDNSMAEQKIDNEVVNNDFEIEAQIGFEQNVVLDKVSPFDVIVKNNSQNPFKGEVQIQVYTYIRTNYEPGKYDIYYSPIELAANSAKEVKFNINLSTIRSVYTIKLVNEKGNTIASKNFNVKVLDPNTSIMAVLSDNMAYLEYLKNIEFSDNSTYTGADLNKLITFDSDTFPESKYVLQNFKILLIDDFNTSILNENQIKAINDWVEAGGMLILGTGINASKTLSGLESIFSFTIAGNEQVSGNLLFSEMNSINNTISINGNIDIASIYLDNSESVIRNTEGIDVTSLIRKEKGIIVIHNFDLALSPISDTPDIFQYLKEVYLNVNPELFTEAYYYEDYDSQNNFNTLRWASRRIRGIKSIGLNIIVFSLILYIIAIPITYIILKKMDKREKGWITLPIMSFVFMILIFGISRNSFYKNSIINTTSVINTQSGLGIGNAQFCIAVRSPKKGDIKVSIDDDLELNNFEDNYYYYYGNYDENDKCSKKILSGEKAEVIFSDNMSWNTNYIYANKDLKINDGITLNLILENNRLKGTIKNGTGKNLYDAVLLVGNKITDFESIEKDEEIEVDLDLSTDINNTTNYRRYNLVNNYFADKYGSNKYGGFIDAKSLVKTKNFTEERAFQLSNHVDFLSDIADMNYYRNNPNFIVKFYAFSDSNFLSEDKYVNDKYVNDLSDNLFAVDAEIDLINSTNFDLPFGFLKHYSIDSLDMYYDEYSNTINSNSKDEGFINYYLPKGNVQLDILQFSYSYDAGVCYAPPEIHNSATGVWEPLQTSEYTNCDDYINENGFLTLKVYMNENQEMTIPYIRVKGGTQ